MTGPVYTCTVAYTGQVTFYKEPDKHCHVYLVRLYTENNFIPKDFPKINLLNIQRHYTYIGLEDKCIKLFSFFCYASSKSIVYSKFSRMGWRKKYQLWKTQEKMLTGLKQLKLIVSTFQIILNVIVIKISIQR